MNILKLLAQSIEKIDQLERQPTQTHYSPEEILKEFSLDTPLENQDEQTLLAHIEKIIKYSPSTSRKDFINLLHGGRNRIAVLGDMLASYMNQTMHTFKTAGVQVILEKEILKNLNLLCGFPNSEGLFLPGGAMSNLAAMSVARSFYFPEAKEQGIFHLKPFIYISENAHYSTTKSANLLGFGIASVRKIACDAQGKMCTDDLEQKIIEDKKHGQPFFINATAGTTVLGVYDSFETISNIARKHQLWLHIDGAYGLAALFSKNKAQYLQGIEYADSISWDAHKVFAVPLLCSILLVRHQGILTQTYSEDAEYLFQTDLEYNPGSSHLQCGRRNNALKLWLYWKYYGFQGLQKHFDLLIELAQMLKNIIIDTTDFHLFQEPASLNVCFNYKTIKAEKITAALNLAGEAKISHGYFQNQSFLRFVCVNSALTKQDLLDFLKKIKSVAQKLE